jgi:hypothetical protein
MSDDDRQTFYHTGEGSEFIPLSFFLALNDPATGQPFIKNLARYGLIPDKESKQNPAGLPIGLTTGELNDSRPGTMFVGVNCAACHVGQINSDDKVYIIDGAPNLFNVELFFKETILALKSNVISFKVFQYLRRTSEYAEAMKEPFEPEDTDNSVNPDKKSTNGEDPRLRSSTKSALNEMRDIETLKGGDAADKAMAAEIEEIVKEQGAAGAASEREAASIGDVEAEVDEHIKDIKAAAPNVDQRKLDAFENTLEDVLEIMKFAFKRADFYWGRHKAAQGTPGGFGRTDAWGTVRSMIYDRNAPPTAPISYPHLWGFENEKYLHWVANTGSAMQRNIGQAIGLTAHVDMVTYESTVNVRNLDQLERLAYKIESPKWSETKLPPIDEPKRAAGAVIYDRLCKKCHDNAKKDGEFRDLKVIPVDEIDTDGNQVRNFQKPVKTKGVDVPFFKALSDLLLNVQKKAYATANVADAEAKSWEYGRGVIDPLWREAKGYVARPLAGIWATAPYLHNGSVPTLDALLRPSTPAPEGATRGAATTPPAASANFRPAEFYVGARTFDPKKVGYVGSSKDNEKFNTSDPGNSNKGHEGRLYGTTLSEKDREALIEYLKSL